MLCSGGERRMMFAAHFTTNGIRKSLRDGTGRMTTVLPFYFAGKTCYRFAVEFRLR
jgi:hypothetical protein